jgi:hypothetical protein
MRLQSDIETAMPYAATNAVTAVNISQNLSE